MYLYHMTNSAKQNSSCSHDAEHMASMYSNIYKVPILCLLRKLDNSAACQIIIESRFHGIKRSVNDSKLQVYNFQLAEIN